MGKDNNLHDTQRDAQYESVGIDQYCNEIHYYKLSSGQYN